MRDLNPWFGDIATLLAMSVPGSGEIEQFKHARAAAEAERRIHAASVARLTSEHRRRAAELEALGTIPGVVPDQAVSRSRAARDEAWVTHRRVLDATSADAFETALRQDDALLSDRHTHGAEVAKRRQAERDVAILAADLRSAIEQSEGASVALAEVEADIAAAIARRTPGLPADATIEQWEEFIHRRSKAVEASERAAAQQRLMANAATDGDIALSRLMAAFDTAVIPYDRTAAFEELLTAANLVIERETEVKGLRSAVRKATKTLAERQSQAALAQQRDSNWCVAWATACASCWLGADGQVPSLAEVRTILADLGDLPAALLLRAGLRSRIVAMEHDQADFNAGIASIAGALDIAHESRPALETAAAIDRMIEVATHAQAEHAKLTRQHDAACRQQREFQRALDEHQKRKAKMTTHFGVDTLHDVGLMLERLATRRALQDQADQAIADILNLLTLPSIEAAEVALDPFDRIALETEAEDLAARFDDCDQQTRTLSTAYTLARDRIDAIGGDDAVARIESKRRTLNLEIDAKATGYLRLRIGIAAAEQALRLYRDRHRSSMMQNASAAFATISRGAYARLDTQVEKDREVLVAIGAESGSKLASELSKGTRFQLYLALRVAGYHEFARTRPSLPFIADDIMETFDDFRAEETFRLFADMAAVGQVIYLTHHRHLIQIARRICPDIHVHTLA
ncbi:hypothetical protein AruPA_19650 [Acidiphilium sp. PA]|uniref:ATP-binding protein n=1 Tax=Acidiphilium sp. PA TaxID=2871705 RepID=UPI0022443B64|nr:hypothetical protein [Acidiphilium sp. PA]MCW8309252.1 hypothetical protein [Acidiphilium sp. PA]